MSAFWGFLGWFLAVYYWGKWEDAKKEAADKLRVEAYAAELKAYDNFHGGY